MKKLLLVSLLINFLAVSIASADSGWFVGGGGGLINMDTGADQVDTGNLVLRGGFHFTDYFDIGAEVGFTFFTDDINDIDHDLQTMMVFIKANLPIGDDTRLYLLAGLSDLKLTQGVANSSTETGDEGTAIGIGVQVRSDNDSFYTVDYITYYDEDEFDNAAGDVKAGGINFGFITYF